MTDSANLMLPYLEADVAQKEVTHNEALNRLDAAVHLSVLDRDLTAPPVSPAEGDRYLVAAGAAGAWAGKDGQIAAYYSGWIFLVPLEGWTCWVADEDVDLRHDGTAWVVVHEFSQAHKDKLDGIEAGAQVNDVTSVHGRVGAVVGEAGDYLSAEITHSPSGGFTGSTVQAAIDEALPLAKWRFLARRQVDGVPASLWWHPMPGDAAPAGWAFSRASTATYVDALGRIATAANDEVRHRHHPVTGEYLGMMVEDAATNLALHSQELQNWALASGCTVNANAAASPNGTADADKIVYNAGWPYGYIYQFLTLAPNTYYTLSAWAKAAEHDRFKLNWFSSETGDRYAAFDLSAGTVIENQGVDARIEAFRDGWYRCSFTFLTAGTVTNGQVQPFRNYDACDGGGLFGWGVQVEAGEYASSYVPTGAGPATRAAEPVSVNGFALDAEEGTLFAEMVFHAARASSTVEVCRVQLDDGSGDNRVSLRLVAGPETLNADGIIVVAGVGEADFVGANPYTLGEPVKMAIAYQTNDAAFAIDGGAVETDTSLTPPAMSRLAVYPWGGDMTIRHIAYFPRRLSNAALQMMTA